MQGLNPPKPFHNQCSWGCGIVQKTYISIREIYINMEGPILGPIQYIYLMRRDIACMPQHQPQNLKTKNKKIKTTQPNLMWESMQRIEPEYTMRRLDMCRRLILRGRHECCMVFVFKVA